MKVKACFLILLAALSASISQPGAQASKISGKVVKMGMLTDMTGPLSNVFGPKLIKSAQLAISDFVQQQKPDFKVELVSADHQNKPEVAVQKVREWFDNDGVTMIADCSMAPPALAVAKLIAERKKVYFVESAGPTRLTNEDCTPYTVHFMADTDAISAGTVNPIIQQGGKTWFLIVLDNAFGASFEKSVRAELTAHGGRVVGAVKHPLGTADFSSYILRAQASHADVVALLDGGDDLRNAVTTANEFGLAKDQLVLPLFLDFTDVRALGLPVVKGDIHSERFYWDLNNETRAFAKHCSPALNGLPNQYDALVYSAVTTYLNAVKTVGTDDADTVMKYLKSTKINDFLCHGATIRADGKLMHEQYLVQAKKPSESKYDGDCYKVLKVIPATEIVAPLAQGKCAFCTK